MMNELIRVEQGEVKLDSRMIAVHFGKGHNDVLKDIRSEIERLQSSGESTEGIFSLSGYKDSTGRKLPCYAMGEEGAMQLAARYDAVARRKLIVKIKELKQQSGFNMPRTFAEALRLAAEREEENERLRIETTQKDQIIGELKPKADYLDRILKSTALVTITQIAKDYGMSGTQMNKLLHEQKVQYKQADQWLLYQKYHAKGYTHSETVEYKDSKGVDRVKMNTKWTQKGRLFIYELLKGVGVLPVIEREKGAA